MDEFPMNPQIKSTFAMLGSMQNEHFVMGSNTLHILEEISVKLSCEDQTLRTFRRAIGIGQNMRKDLIPLLVNAKDSKILDETIRIIVNLTVPVECLFSVDVMLRTEIGRSTIYELNRLLTTSKEAFTDAKASKAVIDHMNSILKEDTRLSITQCENINNCLLLLRNILHIPEMNGGAASHYNNSSNSNNCGSSTFLQNQIVWNLFTQNIDKLLIHLMSCPQRASWSITMVQLIALMYKDQHVNTLQKLLNMWFETSMSESSEDNESNTSPPKQDGGDSSPMLTSDPTSDSSDNGGGSGHQDGKISDRQMAANKEAEALHQLTRSDFESLNGKKSTHCSNNKSTLIDSQRPSASSFDQDVESMVGSSPSLYCQGSIHSSAGNHSGSSMKKRDSLQSDLSEHSDCGYGTQVENQESISTSSNEDEIALQKPVHQKPPCNQKQRYNASIKMQQMQQRNVPTAQDKKDMRKKKAGKRGKYTIMTMGSLLHHTPTDEDISNIIKEFTVDFLVRGYNCLVKELYTQLLTDMQVQIDTCHFFWLVTYFLKFASQLELELEHISWVLSFDIISYLTFEGATLCEQLELLSKQPGCDLKPCLRRMHLVVTAIRESLQALETYNKITHLSKDDKDSLRVLHLQITATEDLKNLFILLLRRYNPALQSKQYLQDLVVTNHILLLLVDGVSKWPDYNGNIKMVHHIKQFATIEIMHHYGLLLENFRDNGEYVNDCIFTMMHHIGGDLGQITTLFQPVILKTFSQIWELEYELCDDWSDLIEYVIHKFINKPQKCPLAALPVASLADAIILKSPDDDLTSSWTQDEINTLYWYYVQSKKQHDIVGSIVKLYRNNGNKRKSRISVIQQLLQQDIITLVGYDDLMKLEEVDCRDYVAVPSPPTSAGESGIDVRGSVHANKPNDDIQVLRDRLHKDNKGHLITWLQNLLVNCCFVKKNLTTPRQKNTNVHDGDAVKVMEPIPYHCILKNMSIPLIPWNSEQNASLTYQPFVLLLHKLGFHLPADVDKLFVRIPGFWTADILMNTAEKLGAVIDKSDLGTPMEQEHMEVSCVERTSSLDDENFAIPRPKHTNSIIRRFTPDPEPMNSSTQNWLELIMRSKCVNSSHDSNRNNCGASRLIATTVTTSPVTAPTMSSLCDTSNLSAMLSVVHDNTIDITSTSQMLSTVMDSTVAAEIMEINDHLNTADDHEVVSTCDTASVASNLTRMYVSDEEHDPQTSLLKLN